MEWPPVYHVKGWGKFNRYYGDFCTGADNYSCIATVRGLAAVRGQINRLAEQNTGRYLIHSQGLIFDTPHSLLASC